MKDEQACPYLAMGISQSYGVVFRQFPLYQSQFKIYTQPRIRVVGGGLPECPGITVIGEASAVAGCLATDASWIVQAKRDS